MMALVKNLSFQILKISRVEMPSQWPPVELQDKLQESWPGETLPMMGMTVQAVRVLLATARTESSSSRRLTSPSSLSLSA